MKKIILIIISLITLIVIYARYIGINGFNINEYTIENSNIPSSFDGLTILQFSDTLYNEYFDLDNFNELVNEINLLEPDIVFFTGDLIDDSYNINDVEKSEIIKYLKSIETTLYKYAIYGDNDKDITQYKSIMDESNFILLDNKTYSLFYKDVTPITITGLTNTSDLTSAYLLDEGITSNFNITLIHKPDEIDNITNNVNAFMSGHSLGGYINLPFLGSITKKDGSNKYYKGYYEEKNIYVSNGLGIEDYPFRLFNTPSINLYRLKSTNES